LKKWSGILTNEKPELIQVDFIDNADLAILIPKQIKKVIVIHDLRFASAIQILRNRGYSTDYMMYVSKFLKTLEVAYINYFDQVLVFSEDDKNQLIDSVDKNKIFISPFAVMDHNFRKLKKEYKVKKIIYVGPDHHSPNLDAVQLYSDLLSETIYDRYGLELDVIGNWSKGNQLRFKKNKHIRFIGFVEDLNLAMQDSVMIVPLRIGSGVRTKIIESFAMGVPVISTTIGCEGIGVIHEQEILIANEHNEFLECLDLILNDEELLMNLRLNAKNFVENNFSSKVCFDKRMSIYAEF
jgi:glycosyltransferase involved in cell wall biosynthesis